VVTASQKEWLIIRSISLWTTQPPSQWGLGVMTHIGQSFLLFINLGTFWLFINSWMLLCIYKI
jgi:hypothetical protein